MTETFPNNDPNAHLPSAEELQRIDADRAAQIGREVFKTIPGIEMPNGGDDGGSGPVKPKIGDTRPSDVPADTSNLATANMMMDAYDAGTQSQVPTEAKVESQVNEAWDTHNAKIAEQQLVEEKAARLQAEQEIEQAMEAAMFDSLTGLPNRAALKEYTDRVGIDGIAGVAVFDLVDFKSVNDHFGGHAAGDEVLVKYSDIMREELADIGMPCRTGGDEFTAAIFANSDPKKVEEAFERIKLRTSELKYDRTSEKTEKDQRDSWNAGASIGYATSDKFKTLEEGLKIADDSMYKDKDKDHKDGNVMTREERR